MAPIIEGPPDAAAPRRPLGRRLAWFAALWTAGLVVTAALAYALRALIT
jgi:hypothetical protein